MDEKRIKQMMKTLKITREEAIEILRDDEAIDKGEKLFELTPEQKKAEKEARKTGFRKNTTPVKRERKVDETKKRIILDIKVLLEGLGAKVAEIKTEAEMHFTFNGDEYTIKLIKHRPPKK